MKPKSNLTQEGVHSMKKLNLTRYGLLSAGILLAGAVLLSGCTNTAEGEKGKEYTRQIEVSGSSDKTVVPDKANLSITVSTSDMDAKTCYTNNAKSVNDTVNAIKALGITDDKIQTAEISLDPQYSYGDDGKKIDNGYMMETTVTITGMEIGQVGDVVAAGVGAGTNEINSLTYESSKYDETYADALKEATEAARKKADVIAAAGGSKVQELISVTESKQDVSVRYAQPEAKMAVGMAADNSSLPSIPTSPGSIKIHAALTAGFRISQ